MPNIKSAKRRVKISERNRLINKAYKTRMKNSIKKVLLALSEGKTKEEVEQLYKIAQSAIDKAAKIGAVHKNEAARRKSRLMSKINKHFAIE
ncbi:30S ribosomal protein S20 [Thermosipho melanesiensis]|uniref:Small ribosomal subunit protein bS20 n=2 Tax=Thermosipho melanesiensis TaxID=46541 RepID=RS20_THEM4|nr:30S ribosomal protein S20 [Thermosipho melanesiensis]A6LNU3.1 RecName: Full=Small ribosomal subunit protein bS20; AltName: Full=30S ribosomal protein S20 [Thermosipho melanesiensis BI429]ABR31594.1 ribosomal protein S20 [Thermosipho melanesiensis BI429]APT74625.1 30S ribosomal protein S20 [Thermosipho melanesiensis]OOC35330.1 30S ribosomal protein S20 [Thermosipho melanesiensis]OOC35548.1 30S ribosomal protein S20 [Thermosipho melanesiensis]OOC36585.1 30S ribosomal protein S20 [Thermosipho